MKALILNFLLISSSFTLSFWNSAHSQDTSRLEINHQGPGQIHLQANDCKKLKIQVKALQIWAQKIHFPLTINESDYKNDAVNKTCRINLAGKLPSFVEKVLDQGPACDGPNCFNSSLVYNKLLPSFRYTTANEINFWLNSPLCRERRPSEKMSPGDIVAIRELKDTDIEEVHAFIHITDELSFSKNGFSKYSPFSLYSPDEVFSTYGVYKDCQRLYSGPSNNCTKFANVFTCENFEDFYQANVSRRKDSDPETAEIDENHKRLCKIEKDVEQMSWDGKYYGFYSKSPYPSEKFFVDSLNVIKELAKQKVEGLNKELEKKNGLLSKIFESGKIKNLKNRKFLWSSLFYRAVATNSQKTFIPNNLFSK